jgi:serralysin
MIHMRWSRFVTVCANLVLCLALALSFAPGGWAGQVEVEEAENEMLYLPLAMKNSIPFIESTGVLDNSFDGDGWAVLDFGCIYEYGKDVALQPDGKIVVAGYVVNCNEYNTDSDIGVARFNPDGSADFSFGIIGLGRVITQISVNNDSGSAVVIQPDGKIVVAGTSSNNFALLRYTPTGKLDTSFDGDGILTTDFSGGSDTGRAVALQPDGKIIVAGTTYAASNDFALARYNSDGSLDTTFDGNGLLVTDINSGSSDDIFNIVLQPDGKIVAVGRVEREGGLDDFAMARYNPDGSMDTTFDGDGLLVADFAGGFDGWLDVVLQPDGKIVTAGYTGDSANRDFAVARYNPDGSPDNTFDLDGIVVTDFAGGDDYAGSVSLQPGGKIIAAGRSEDWFAAARYNLDGSLDLSFSADGMLTVEYVFAFCGFGGALLQADGKIVSTGTIMEADFNFGVWRIK